MIVFIGPLLQLAFTPAFRLISDGVSAVEIHGWNPDFSKRELIGAVVISFAWFEIADNHPALFCRCALHELIHAAFAQSDDLDIVCRTEKIDPVDVDQG